MKPRDSLLPVAVMAIGTTGCFETQRDETFADTVVHDDTEIRVLHASPDAPRLDLLLDGDRSLEDLDYGQTHVLTPPADWYDVAVEGRVGADTRQTMWTPESERFEEDRRYDLLLAGSADADDNTLRTVLLVRDEPEDSEDEEEDEDDESLSVRGVHLAESAEESANELDVFINGDHEEPLTTLVYGEGSESLELDEAVVRIRLQKPDGDEPLFDSGKRKRFRAGEELLVAVVPNTSASADEDGGSPVKVLILNGDEVTTLRNEAEQSSLRFVHAAAESGNLDVDVKSSAGDAVWEAPESTEYEEVLPSADPGGFVFLDSGSYDVTLTESDNGESQSTNARWRRGHGRTIHALNDADKDLDLKTVPNNDRSVATNARVRLFHGSPNAASGSDGPGAIDVYLLQEGQDLAEEGVVATPVLSSLGFRKMSRYEPIPDGDYDLVVTRADDTSDELIRQESVTLSDQGIYDLVFAGEGKSNGEGYDFQLIQIGGVP